MWFFALFVVPPWIPEVVRFEAGTLLRKAGVKATREQRKKTTDTFLDQADGGEIGRDWSGEWE